MSAEVAPSGAAGDLSEEVDHLRRRLMEAEDLARSAERRHRVILDGVVDCAIVTLDPDGRITAATEGARQIFGWSEAELLGRPASVLFTEEDRRAGVPEAEMQAALERGRGHDERWRPRKDGSCFWAGGEMMPLRDEAGRPQGFVSGVRDLTGQRLAAEKDRSDAEFLTRVLAASDDCIKVLDLDGGLTFMSEGGQRMMEVDSFDALRGCFWADFWQEEEREKVDAALAVARAGGSGRFCGTANTMAGNPRDWAVQVTPILGADGRPEKLLSISRDITATRRAESALRASEAHWRSLFEHLQEGLIIGELVRDETARATDWRYLDVNAAWGEQVGIPAEEAVGRTIRDLFPGIEEGWVSEMAVVVETRRSAKFLRQVGSIGRWFEGHAYPLEGDRFAALLVEVTERKRTEDRRFALLELNDRLREVTDLTTMASISAEVVGHAVHATSAGYATMDADADGFVIERDWTSPGTASIAGRYRLQDFGRYGADLALGAAVTIADVRLDPRTVGHVAALEAAGGRAFINLPVIEHGRLVAVLFVLSTEPRGWSAEEEAFCRDVAERTRVAVERRRAEQASQDLAASLEQQVEERTRQYDRVWCNSQDLQVVVDAQGVFQVVNPAATLVLGWTTEEMQGTHLLDRVHPDDARASRTRLAEASSEPSPPLLNRCRGSDGDYRWISWTTTPAEGLIYCYGRDVTAETTAAAERERLEEQLRQSQKMEAVGQLTGGLAHDFNNLLTGVTGSLELLQSRIAQGRIKEVDRYVVAAQGAARRAAALTHRLLAFSRRQTLEPRATDINRLVVGMEDLIRRTVGPEITIEPLIAAGDLWSTMVDPGQLENALLNLCINARDAMPDGGKITVETANRRLDPRAARERDLPPGQYVTLCVSDTGTGMTPDVIAKAFDPFFTTKPLGRGTGLGLSMIYGFARQSGGQVQINSEAGRGTMMCLYLPRSSGPAETAQALSDPASPPRAVRGETVLVVDDEPTVRMLVAEVLEDLGYAALEAVDGAAGLKVLQSSVRIDLLITDVGLPGGMNGRQVADAARVARPDLKVLFITGYAENAVLSHGHLDPGMHVLTKPFAVEALARRIRDLITGAPTRLI